MTDLTELMKPGPVCPFCPFRYIGPEAERMVRLPHPVPVLELGDVFVTMTEWAHESCAEDAVAHLEAFVKLASGGQAEHAVHPKARSVLRKMKAERTQKDPVLVARARLAIASRNGQSTAALKQELNYANLHRAITKALGDAGLSDAQRSALTELLNS